PTILSKFPAPVWMAPDLDPSSPHLLVGGSTVWVEQEEAPASIVAAQPNAVGGVEDLAALVNLTRRYQAKGWLKVDPLLLGHVRLPPPLRSAVSWPQAPGSQLEGWGERVLQSAAALAQRLQQVPGLAWPVRRPAGRTVTVLAPHPASTIRQRLQTAGVLLADPVRWWEGILVISVGWWHTGQQLDGLAKALAAAITGDPVPPVEDDQFHEVPDDLPRRRLNRIRAHLEGAP
ncbi:MAG TPA: hypothetical protein VJR05_11430, partial [Acidimicrobiia bacterium]|nr:hypothetical protein [Acidimicrobiia bacterium]